MDAERLLADGAQVAIAVGEGEAPITEHWVGDTILVAVPHDIVELRRRDPELGTRWRETTREVLAGALNDGYVVVSMTRSGYYVLEKAK